MRISVGNLRKLIAEAVCPLCGDSSAYQGFSRFECSTKSCPNYSAKQTKTIQRSPQKSAKSISFDDLPPGAQHEIKGPTDELGFYEKEDELTQRTEYYMEHHDEYTAWAWDAYENSWDEISWDDWIEIKNYKPQSRPGL